MRGLLRDYAMKCNAGLAIVVNCAPVDPRSIEGHNWVKKKAHSSRKHGTKCKLKNTVFRNNTLVNHSPGPGFDVPINTTYLKQSNIDILGGHITLGLWQNPDMQYLSFFRESTRKVVSATVFMNPNLSGIEEAVELVKLKVRKAVQRSRYLDNSYYIITPEQQMKLANVRLTMEQKVNLMIQNMKEHKFLFGIVERMSESLEMLQYVVDKDGELDDLFELYGMIPPGKNKTEDIVMNKSKLSSSAVLAEVEKDEEFMEIFREYVKWDAKVYQFALEMHKRQYEEFQRQTRMDARKDPPVVQVERVKIEDNTSRAIVVNAVNTTPEIGDYSGKIEPMWRCSDKDRKKKLVFVHVFKTAVSKKSCTFSCLSINLSHSVVISTGELNAQTLA